MDVKELKNYIYENNYCEQILESVGCHHIKYHSVGAYWTAGNPDGDNKGAIILYNNESLICLNKTRQMIRGNRQTDIIDLVCYVKDLTFPEGLKEICSEIGMSYYHDFEEDIPDSFKILKMLEDMDSNISEEKEKPLQPISEKILSYYKPYVNDLFYEDHINYETQREFEIGFDEETNRYTIPIRSELGGDAVMEVEDEQDVEALFGAYYPVLLHFRKATVASVDADLNMLCMGEFDEVGKKALVNLFKFLRLGLKSQVDYEMIQALLDRTLQLYGSLIPSIPKLKPVLEDMQAVQEVGWRHMQGLIQESLCLVELFSNIQL